MSNVDTQNEGVPKHESLPDKLTILYYVVETLKKGLDSSRLTHLELAKGKAEELLREMKLDDQALDARYADTVEKVILLLGIAHESNIQTEGFSDRDIRKQLVLLYGNQITNSEYIQEQRKFFSSTVHIITVGLLNYFWGDEFRQSDEEDFFAWISKHKMKDRVVELPLKQGDNQKYTTTFKSVWDAYNIPEDQRMTYTAVAVPESGFIVVFQDAPEIVRFHELAHLDNDGLSVGEYGDALNEVITEYTAGLQLKSAHNYQWDERTRSGIESILYAGKQYNASKRMFMQMLRFNSKLLAIVKRRYQYQTNESSFLLAQRLINDFGWSLYVRMYMAHGNIRFVGQTNRQAGLLWPEIVTKQLYDLNEQYGRQNEW